MILGGGSNLQLPLGMKHRDIKSEGPKAIVSFNLESSGPASYPVPWAELSRCSSEEDGGR